MADYKVEVDLSDLFDDMTISEQKSFLVDKFCSLPLGSMEEVAGEMLENLNGDQTAKVIEDPIKELLIKYYRSEHYKVATWMTKDNMTEIYLKRKY